MSASVLAEDFSFDLSDYEKSPYDIGGYIELSASHAQLNTDSGLYNLQLNNNPIVENKQYIAGIQLDGLYRFSKGQLYAQYFAETQDSDTVGNRNDSFFHELYYSNNHINNLTIDLGKRVQKWGKGYAWNPVGFIERKKDPNDPELSREGYVMLSADYVQSFEHDLKTLSVMPVLLPVTSDVNDGFSLVEDTNLAGKVYFLYRDIDIDIMFLAKGSRAARIGFDFSGNVLTNFEIHGEFAYIKDETINLLDSQNQVIQQEKNIIQSLLGFRYLTNNDITWIAEYYHNGAGYTESQLEQFLILSKSDLQTNPQLLNLLQQASRSGYGSINPGRDYLYLSAIKKEPYNFVYLNMGIKTIINIRDQSYSLTPELTYAGINNTEMRLRLIFLKGNEKSEFGERINDSKIEFRFRYYF